MTEDIHQLAAIMFTDIVGYSAMMQQSEQTALKAVEESLALQGPIIEEHRGKILKKMGDGVISIFSSTYDAVQCGIKLQKIFNKDSELQLKIAIHEGDVLIKDEDVFGDGINIAARIESLSVAGAILISDKVKSEIQNKNIETVSLGAFHLKNIDQPVHIHAVSEEALIIPKKSDLKGKRVTGISQRQKVMIGAISLIVIVLLGYNWQNIFGSSDDSSITKIAVVPFSTSDHEDIQYLGEGMMDILSNKFSMLPGLTSLDPQISYSLYNKAGTDFLNIIKLPFWQENRYDYLVTGSVIKLGTVTKFIGKLLDNEGKEISVIELDCSDLSEVSNCIDQFSRQMISELQNDLRMDFSDQAPFSTDNWDALKEYMLAENARRSNDPRKANGHYSKAVEIDSTFALAWLRGFTNAGQWYSDIFPFTKVMRYSHKLSPELRKYVLAISKSLEGDVYSAIDDLNDLLHTYGDNVDVILQLGGLAYWNVYKDNGDLSISKDYFSKVYEYDPGNLGNEETLIYSEIFAGNSEFIKNHYNYYVGNEISGGNRLLMEIANYNLTIVDSLYYEGIYELFVEDLRQNSNLSLNSYLMATPRPLALIGRLDVFTKALENNDYLHLLNSDKFDELDFFILLTQGKFMEVFKKYPEKFYSYWETWTTENMHEPDFQILNKERAQSILKNLPRSYDPNNKYHRYSKAFYSMIIGNSMDFDDGINFLEELKESELENNLIDDVQRTNFFLNRLKYNYYRTQGDPITAQLYLDSLFNSYRYDFRSRGGLIWSPKFTEASIAMELGDLSKAKMIFENLEFWPWFLTYAPLKYKLAQVYDQLGEDEKAFEYYKHFYTIYKDCDDFYQDNVAYAKERIAYYESTGSRGN